MFDCLDCGTDTGTDENCEYYMVHEELWVKAHPEVEGMLCIGCLEKRIDRKLTAFDFIDAPINRGIFPQSIRLKRRLAG